MKDPKLPFNSEFCKCPACGLYFTNEGTFDMHRRDSPTGRECVDPSSLYSKAGKARMALNAKGYWARPGGFHGERA